MSRATDPQISVADLEFLRQGIQLERPLKVIAAFLDTHAALVNSVRRDLVDCKHQTGSAREPSK